MPDETDLKVCAEILGQLHRSKEFSISTEEKELIKKVKLIVTECYKEQK